MKKQNSSVIKLITGSAFRLPGKEIDTDRIIPARFLKCVTFTGLGEKVFADDREKLEGKHPFDEYNNLGCEILIVDENFGCGSSREHAVPALAQWGIKCIIGLSFADIFAGNAASNGLVCVTIGKDAHDILVQSIDAARYNIVIVNLETMMINVDNGITKTDFPCHMPEAQRENLIAGTWDAIATCLEAGSEIEKKAAELPNFRYPVLVKI